MDKKALAALALDARKYSYSPYSGFKVGAALLAKDGRTFTGANIENAAYTPSNCAERTAVFKAVSEGAREFEAIAVAGGRDGEPAEYCYPCGVCRQVLAEFVKADEFIVLVAKSAEDYREHVFGELLPFGFGPDDLR